MKAGCLQLTEDPFAGYMQSYIAIQPHPERLWQETHDLQHRRIDAVDSNLNLPVQHQRQAFGMHFCCHSLIICAALLFGCRHSTTAAG